MSVEAMAMVLHHARATGTQKLVLLGVANHQGDGGAWPTIRTLAKYAGVSERSTQRAVRELVRTGQLNVELQNGGTRDTPDWDRPNRYLVLVACPPDCDGSMNHRPRPAPAPGSQLPVDNPGQDPKRQGGGDTGVTRGGDTGVTRTSPNNPAPTNVPTSVTGGGRSDGPLCYTCSEPRHRHDQLWAKDHPFVTRAQVKAAARPRTDGPPDG